MKKKLYLLIFVAAITITSCDVLDVEPALSVPASEAIKDRTGLERVLTGSYDALQSAGYYGRDYLVLPDLASDNLEWTGTTAGYNQIDNNAVLSDNTIIEGIWASIYTAINRTNYVIEAIPQLTDLTEAQGRQYRGEAHFLRALHHFNLVRMFGGVPIRTKPVRANESDLNIARNSVEQVYQQILSDLILAKETPVLTTSGARAGKAAALALSARVYLTMYGNTNNNAHLDSAAFYANRVISEFNYILEPDYAKLFSRNPTSEIIFYVDFIAQDRNRLAEYFFTRNLSGRKEFSPTPNILSAYTANDTMRKSSSAATAADGPYAIKYNDIANGTDNVPVLRLAEMHLILAEAIARKGGDAATVREQLNLVRQRAGLEPATSNDLQTLLNTIENERRLEFAFEGHRWFDLVRTNRIAAILPGLADCYKLFPIPLSEIQANEAISPSDQNECY